MRARCLIDGRIVPIESVAKRVMNFGQEAPGRAALEYEIALRVDEFAAEFADAHRQTLEELEADAAFDPDDEMTLKLREAGWPDLRAIMKLSPELFEGYIKTYLFSEVLDGVARAPVLSATYQLNSLRTVAVHGDEVLLRGTCYESGARTPSD